jgi:hypothetical protein
MNSIAPDTMYRYDSYIAASCSEPRLGDQGLEMVMTTINYTMQELAERLGTEATIEDAETAMERAEGWYNATPKQAVLAWYETHRLGDQHAADINDPDAAGQLIDGWNEIVIFHRAASLIDA